MFYFRVGRKQVDDAWGELWIELRWKSGLMRTPVYRHFIYRREKLKMKETDLKNWSLLSRGLRRDFHKSEDLLKPPDSSMECSGNRMPTAACAITAGSIHTHMSFAGVVSPWHYLVQSLPSRWQNSFAWKSQWWEVLRMSLPALTNDPLPCIRASL